MNAVHFDDNGETSVLEANPQGEGSEISSVSFDTDSFSVFGIVYTVDFEYSVNGKMYQFSLPGGEKITLSDLVEVLGIIGDTNSGEKAAFNSVEDFLKEVANVEFSDESLVKVIKNEEGNDWTLESLQPFDTEESLTITMKNGDVITVKVTDAQIVKEVLTSKGETYTITLTYDDKAGIPEDAELNVREIQEGSEEYTQYLEDTADRLGMDDGDLSLARFFDIEILAGNEKIEPGSNVQVNISLRNAAPKADEAMSVVHFGENGPEVLEAKTKAAKTPGTTEMQFEAGSFSVYGVVAAPAGSFAGRSFTMDIGGRYVTSNAVEDSTHKLGKTNQASQAAEWTFEDAGNGQVYIYTYLDEAKTEKRYIYMTQKDGDSAHTDLNQNDKSAFTLIDTNDGTYAFKTTCSGKDYYLNEFSGPSGNGFAGWKERYRPNDRIRVTFSQPTIENNGQYVLVTKYNGEYYIVLNDGTLELAERFDEANNALYGVEMNHALLWTYGSEDGKTFLRHAADSWKYQGNQLPANDGILYSYINPTDDAGITSDTGNKRVEDRPWGKEYFLDDRTYGTSYCVYDADKHIKSNTDSTKYIGVVEENGSLKLKGNASSADAVEIYFATILPSTVPEVSPQNHTVNHIDISVEGSTEYKVPLAYGTYYWYDDNDTTHSNPHELVVGKDHNLTLTLNKAVDVVENDLKKAELKTYRLDGDKQTYLDDTFYITGYTGNASNGLSTAQVRMEGVFKVADLDPYEKNHNGDENSCSGAYTDFGNSNTPDPERAHNDIKKINELYSGLYNGKGLLQARLDNRIYYELTISKDVEFPWLYNGKQLYDGMGSDAKALKSTVNVNLSTTFDYWDEANECPPLAKFGDRNKIDWKAGMINGDGGPESSGMDFKLKAHTEAEPDTVAVEIVKEIRDTEGNVLSPKNKVSNSFEIYRKNDTNSDEFKFNGEIGTYSGTFSYDGYNHVDSVDLDVGRTGQGIAFDYDVPEGKVYIEENKESIQKYFQDAKGNYWQYDSTQIATEYVWRNDGFDYVRHFSDTYTEDSASLRSIPDMLGSYQVNGSGTWTIGSESGDFRNGFLEFYVYNVYKPAPTVDVPATKTWEDASEWTARFVLQWAPLYEGQTKPTTDFTDYLDKDGERLYVDLSNTNPTNNDAFTGLPKYGVDAHGVSFRYQYSLEELSYTATVNGKTISWDGSTYTGQRYEPLYPHDAGELSADDTDYFITVSNVSSNIVDEEYINVPFNKSWENGAIINDDSYATFNVYRYKRQAYRDTSHMQEADFEADPITITLKDTTGKVWDTITVQPRAGVYLSLTLSPNTAGRTIINYSGGSVSGNVDNNYNNSINLTKTSDHFYLTEDTVITLSSENNTLSYLLSAQLLDTETGTAAAFDDNFEQTFTLNNGNSWHTDLNLKTMEVTASDGTNQNVTYYDYYFVETESNPEGYYADLTPAVSRGNRLSRSVTVNAENKKTPPFYVKKEWHDIEDPDNYPEIRFTLYQGVMGKATDYSVNPPREYDKVMEGSVFVDDNGNSYVDIPLNSDNNWTWKCPGYLPTENANGQTVGYYVVENTGSDNNKRQVLLYNNSELNPDGSIKVEGEEITTSQSTKDEIWLWDYYNDQNDNRAYRNDQQQPKGYDGGVEGNTGTLTIVNRSPKYMQMDIKKKIMEYIDEQGNPSNSLATTTGWKSRTKDIVLKIQLMRRIYLADAAVDAEPLVNWSNYGVPFYVGYDSAGNDITQNTNDFDVGVGLSAWHWTILDQNQENGLPAYGYYTKDDGEVVKVHYRYIPFEIGAYKNIQEEELSEEFDWFIGLQPSAWDGAHGQVGTFTPLVGQDQDRLMNIQASDLEVDKDWTQTPDNVSEVYVKIYRQAGNSDVEDFTEDIATRTDILDVYGFVDDPTRLTTLGDGVLVLGLTPETGGVLIHDVLMTPATESGNLSTNYYEYWIEEVGYKDKDGNVYLTNGTSSATSTFFAQYDKSDANGEWSEAWKDNPGDNRLKLSTKGKNKLRVKNQPTRDIQVMKQWVDENGNVLDGPWNKSGTEPVATSISFKVKRSDGQYLTFGNSQTLTISTDGQRAVVRTDTQDSTAYTVTYVDDATDKADIGSWTTLVHGLQKYASNGTEYTYTVEELVDQNGKPLDGSNNVIQNCQTSVIGDENTGYVIKNEKTVTSLAIEKKFAGEVELTEEQKRKITFTVTGKFDGSSEETRIFTYGLDGITVNGEQQQTDTYKWQDGTLVIRDIAAGEYIVTEHNDEIASIFETIPSGKAYVHTRTYKVGETQTTDKADATVTEGERTTVTVTNTYDEEELGSLQIEKKVTYKGGTNYNEKAILALKGTYTFTIYKDEACKTPYMENGQPKTLKLTVGEDMSTVTSPVVTGIPLGKYWIEETELDNGVFPITNPIEVNVTAGNTPGAQAVAHFTNDYTDGPDEAFISVTKKFTGVPHEEVDALSGFKITVTDSKGNQYVLEKNTHGWQSSVDNSGDTVWTWKIYNIPVNETLTYTASEEGYQIEGYRVTPAGFDNSITLSPSQMTFDYKGTIDTTNSHTDWDVDNTIFAASLTKSIDDNKKSIVFITKRSLSMSQRKAVKTILIPLLKQKDANGNWDLADDRIYFYSVDMHPDGFRIQDGTITFDVQGKKVTFSAHSVWKHVAYATFTVDESTEAGDIKVRNDYEAIPVELDVIKVDQDTIDSETKTYLKGADFQITKLEETGHGEYKTKPDSTTTPKELYYQVTKSSGDNGRLTFDGLNPGYYEITEVKSPDGYILLSDPFYIRIYKGVITRIKKTVNDPETESVDEGLVTKWPEETDNSGMIRFEAAKKAEDDGSGDDSEPVENQNASFTVGNQKGSALPNTGGPGTRLFTILGSILILGAGVLLCRRRRLI